LLPTVTRFSVKGAYQKYATISRIMNFAKTTESDEAASMKLITGLEELNNKLKIPRLRYCLGRDQKIFEESLEKMAQDAIDSGSPDNNPIVPTLAEIIELYRDAW
jgi:alcohol dehydrogenase class IV